jgi:pimeloyl-ACP methyl ester carboxylesterase
MRRGPEVAKHAIGRQHQVGRLVRLGSGLALLAVGVLSTTGASASPTVEVPCSQHTDTQLQSMTDKGIGLTSALGLAPGRYALPSGVASRRIAPTQLVVMFHGHGNDSCSWRRHLQQAAARGAVAVAMDYTGQVQTPVENYGWRVREGAADSIAAAQYFLGAYPSITTVYAFGISMGGNAAGLAVASPAAVRADGSPLFDYFVDVEGVNNLIEEYLVARGVAPVNDGGALAQREIEEENGGSLEAAPQSYAEASNVVRAPDMSRLRGAVIVNGVDDGLVPTNQSPEMAAALVAVGVPSHLVTVLARGGAESGSTLTEIAGDPLLAPAGQQYVSPFAGHGWEGSDTQLVIKTGFKQLFALMGGGTVKSGETIVPGL